MNRARFTEADYKVLDDIQSKFPYLHTMSKQEIDDLYNTFIRSNHYGIDGYDTEYISNTLVNASFEAWEREEHEPYQHRTYCGVLGCHNYTTSMAYSDRMYLDGVWICPECAGRL